MCDWFFEGLMPRSIKDKQQINFWSQIEYIQRIHFLKQKVLLIWSGP